MVFVSVRGLFSSCGKWGPLFIAVRRPLIIAASLVAEHKLQTRRLSNCGSRASCSAACGIFPDQGSNPCPLNWQADSQPLRHQGSPQFFFIHSSVDGHLGCFYVLAVVNNAAVNNGVHVSFLISVFFFLDMYPGVELLGHIVVLFLVF